MTNHTKGSQAGDEDPDAQKIVSKKGEVPARDWAPRFCRVPRTQDTPIFAKVISMPGTSAANAAHL
jgi:hypothetical protein